MSGGSLAKNATNGAHKSGNGALDASADETGDEADLETDDGTEGVRGPRGDTLPTLDVLVVEDDPSVAAAIAASFRLQTFEVRCADSVASARDALDERLPTALSVDLNLPDGHGFDIVREARRRGVRHVVVISGERKRDNVLASLELDVFHYLVKPIRMSALLSAVQALRTSLES